MKQKTILIGGGVIARHYKKGLENSETLQLVALVDTNENCLARSCFSVPFYTELNYALALKPQIALLALPVAARSEVTRELLGRGIAVLTEKPMFANLDEIENMLELSESCGAPLACLFHWKAAAEVRFLKRNSARLGKIRSIKTMICDDYAATESGAIRPDRIGLMGAWIDSGINVLSYYDELIDLSNAVLTDETLITDSHSGLPKYARKEFDASGIRAEITVDWRNDSREKTSQIECESGTASVNHTLQPVTLNGEEIYSRPTADRLSSHYENLFRNITMESLNTEKQSTLLLHKLLFTGGAR